MTKWIVLIAVFLVPAWAQLPPIPGGNQPPPPGAQTVVRGIDYSDWYVIAAEVFGMTAYDLQQSENSILQEAQSRNINPVFPLLYIFVSEYHGLRDLYSSGQLTISEVQTLQRAAFIEMVKFLFRSPDALAGDSGQTIADRWDAMDLENYILQIQIACECIGIPGFEGTIQGGELQSVDVQQLDWVEQANGQYVLEILESEAGDLDTYNWVTADGIIQRALLAIDNDAEYVRIKYDPVYGYISDLYVDFSSFIADEELSYRISIIPLENE